MAKAKKADPANESDVDDAPASGSGKKISKSDAVRAAIKAGYEMPQDGVAYIKRQFGIDTTTQNFSTIKSIDKKKAAELEGNGQADGGINPVGITPVGRPRTADRGGHNGAADVADSVQAIKKLVDQLGAEQVKKIADIFG